MRALKKTIAAKWVLTLLALHLLLTAFGCAGEDTVPEVPNDGIAADSFDTVEEIVQPTVTHSETTIKERLAPEFTSEILQVRRNEIVTVTVKGLPETEYTILVRYHSGHESTANGLGAAMSDANGDVSWTWRVGGKTGFGKAAFVVSGGGEKTTYEFEVVE